MASWRLYGDRRVMAVFGLGILSGLPWVMIGSALTLWLQEAGLSRSQIGFAGLIFAVYAVNFVWAPLLDRLDPLGKVRRLARFRLRNWILVCQSMIAIACLGMSFCHPESAPQALILWALLVAFTSATQDIAIDAYRVQVIEPHETALLHAASGAATSGWWTGYAGLGALPLLLSDAGLGWAPIYQLLALVSLAAGCGSLLLPALPGTLPVARFTGSLAIANHYKPAWVAALATPWLLAIWAFWGLGLPDSWRASAAYVPLWILIECSWVLLLILIFTRLPWTHETTARSPWDPPLNALYGSLIQPLWVFMQQQGLRLGLTVLAFIVLFKCGEAFLGRMSIVFYSELGFSKSDIALFSKTLTWFVTVAAALPCALINARFGVMTGLALSGVAMAASNLLFAGLAVTGPVLWLYGVSILVDGITTAWATVAFVAFISSLCHRQFSATHYALLASLGNLGRTVLASNSGWLVDLLGGNWALFFAVTALMVLPALCLLYPLSRAFKAKDRPLKIKTSL
jgi:MFS transporter, PAT family, beta-lactamase induction signal transducer AmpG